MHSSSVSRYFCHYKCLFISSEKLLDSHSLWKELSPLNFLRIEAYIENTQYIRQNIIFSSSHSEILIILPFSAIFSRPLRLNRTEKSSNSRHFRQRTFCYWKIFYSSTSLFLVPQYVLLSSFIRPVWKARQTNWTIVQSFTLKWKMYVNCFWQADLTRETAFVNLKT